MIIHKNISYKNYRKNNDIHGTVLYPGIMVAPMQNDILKSILEYDKNISTICDPFHGSGTTLYEASQISEKIKLLGCDINPIANLISKVKLQGVSSNIYKDITLITNLIENKKCTHIHSFPNIKKWFRDDIIESLSIIRSAIINIKDKQNRLYFWYMLLNIIRKYSNTRSSTFKLHIKPENDILKLKNAVISDFLIKINKDLKYFLNKKNIVKLEKKDVIDFFSKINSHSIDIIITSPPYGDNATTITYGQFSMLMIYWIDKKDLILDGWEHDNYSIIDSKSLGGCLQKATLNDDDFLFIKPYINKITGKKLKKVHLFFAGYFNFLRHASRVSKKYIIMTLGNRTVDCVNIDLTKITSKYLEKFNFKNIQTLKRDIPIKRIPKLTSKVKNKSVASMNSEFMIIHKRS